MNSFRVIDTRFRILKGGKIGLSLSIALIGSMLTLGSIKADAVDYFTDVQKNVSVLESNTSGFFDLTVETAANTGTFNLNRSSTTNDSVVFKPLSWVSSTYGIPTFGGDLDVNNDSNADGSTYLLNTTIATEQLNLTFNTNANAGSISKDNTTVYSAQITGNVSITSNNIYNLDTVTSTAYKANLIFQGSNVISGATNIGDGNIKLDGSVTFDGTVESASIDVDTIDTIIFNSDVNLSAGTTDAMEFSVNGNVSLNEDFIGNITTTANNQGNVTILGSSTGKEQVITGNIGSSSLLDINTLNIGSGANYSRTVITGDVFANSTILDNNGTTNDSTLILTNGSDITSNITSLNSGMGILTLQGSSTVSGTVGTINALKDVNSGVTGTSSTFSGTVNSQNITNTGTGTTTFQDNVTATNVNVNAGITTFHDSLSATTSTITSGTGNFNTVSGTTSSNIVFGGDGIGNLNNGLTGNIDFAGNDATVNVSDGKGILGSTQTLANNTGILNYKGDGTISGDIGSSTNGIKELNINTNNEQNTPDGVLVSFDALGRELYVDVVGLRNNATLTLSDNTNMTNKGLDNILVTTDVTNTGTLTFQGTSNIEGEVGESNKVLNTINAGATTERVTFDDMVYSTNLKYSDNGTVVLNGDTSGNTSEGIIGTVNFDSKAGTLEIGDSVNLTTGTSGIQFANANSATLTFNGSSNVTGVLGGNTAGNSTLERIYAGANSSIVTFKNDVYVEESNDTTLHVSGTGTVNFEGNLTGDLIYDADGIVNVSNGKSIIVSTVPTSVRTQTDNTGTLNYLGTTTLYSDIGTASNKLKNVTFASSGTSSDSYVMDLSKNIYAQNTYIGNSSNNTTVNITDNITFGGNLDMRNNSILNVSDFDLTVTDNLNIASNSTLKFKVYTTDISAGSAVENPSSGSITANSISLSSDTKINVIYDGSWYGAGKYNLITATSSTGTYYGTELNGLVSDNSIIDSIVKNDGTNLTLFADRTGGGAYNAEDLYIVKSEIGDHYSNGASQALAGYANEAQREGALSDIIRRMEELEGGTILTADKKAQMVRTQKLLAPIANNSTIKSSLVATNTVLSTISDRISDIRTTSSMDFIPWGGDYSGLSSGDYMQDYALWIKAMGAKATQSKVKDYDGYETSTYGLVAGVDKTLRDGTTIGIALANSDTKINQTDFRAGDSSSTKSIQLSTYASKELGDAYVDGVVSYAKHSTEGSRTANSGKLTSSVDADQLSAKVETGYRVYLEDIATLTPFVSFEYGTLNQKAYTEKGTAYQNDALKVGNTKITKGNVGLGTKISTNLNLGNVLVVPEVKFGVYNAIGDKNADIKAQYTGGGNEFVTPTQDLTDTMYKAGIGVKTTLSESTSLMLGVDYDRSKDGGFEGYSGNVSFRLSF